MIFTETYPGSDSGQVFPVRTAQSRAIFPATPPPVFAPSNANESGLVNPGVTVILSGPAEALTLYSPGRREAPVEPGFGRNEGIAPQTQSGGQPDSSTSTTEQSSENSGKETDGKADALPGTVESEEGLTREQIIDLRQLQARDKEVRQHEAAHQAVGGPYAGAISFSYQRGPDGVAYAVGGEVPIDISPIAGDPQATIEKMRVVRAAALAPAQPSAQDRQVAALATQAQLQAQVELASGEEDNPLTAAKPGDDGDGKNAVDSSVPDTANADISNPRGVVIYQALSQALNDLQSKEVPGRSILSTRT